MLTTLSNIPAAAPALEAGFVRRAQEDDVTACLLRPRFPAGKERLILLGFDAYGRLLGVETTRPEKADLCAVPSRCWRALSRDGVHHVVMAHNHPSGTPWPSDADRRCTQKAAALLASLGIELADHLIFVENGHFSFRRAALL
ncbi:JAB domain-containing protein [Sphingopyxis sp. MWB1]|uniref:JAB domain-containing protein n=1 Tax=Sphingopyxis sp. MWB1 TaxID=1537715 RepID=UPI00068F2A52|nr:JAB domain-containing protein [Sphingopyxis sp. MWB1]